ncbi:hypothetical protein JW868_04815 [Candidatus Woesearchaeota archaeon]|nr:hypothetical protein [Candidatus Woesearchaeota archaeon]
MDSGKFDFNKVVPEGQDNSIPHFYSEEHAELADSQSGSFVPPALKQDYRVKDHFVKAALYSRARDQLNEIEAHIESCEKHLDEIESLHNAHADVYGKWKQHLDDIQERLMLIDTRMFSDEG